MPPESILKIIGAYEKVQPNLLKHEKGYPAAAQLKAKVKKGLPLYGMQGVGDGKHSEGSEWIIESLEKMMNAQYGFPYGAALTSLPRPCGR